MSHDKLIDILERKGLLTNEEAEYIRETTPVVTEFKVKKKQVGLNYDSWPCLPDAQLIKDWLISKKKAKGSISQSAIDTVGKELHRAVMMGLTVEQWQ